MIFWTQIKRIEGYKHFTKKKHCLTVEHTIINNNVSFQTNLSKIFTSKKYTYKLTVI